jgi:hypothetical protein
VGVRTFPWKRWSRVSAMGRNPCNTIASHAFTDSGSVPIRGVQDTTNNATAAAMGSRIHPFM